MKICLAEYLKRENGTGVVRKKVSESISKVSQCLLSTINHRRNVVLGATGGIVGEGEVGERRAVWPWEEGKLFRLSNLHDTGKQAGFVNAGYIRRRKSLHGYWC